MLWLLVTVPLLAGLSAFAIRTNWPRRMLFVVTAAIHAGLAAASLMHTPTPILDGWIALDATASLFLAITSSIFLVTSFYAIGYLAKEETGSPEHNSHDLPFVNYPEATFTGCCLLFLAAMTLVIVSRHWGLMWVAVEATTLASAPLIYFHRSPKSLEATWKYLLICSVGIALALLGNFFLAVATRACPGGQLSLFIGNLESHAKELDPLWLKASFLLLVVGYGTKMGLAPLHTWLPDAHSEAPSMISALLSGVLLNCAFLAILRGHSLLVKAGIGDFSQDILVLFGLLSMSVAGLFIIGQMDYKRLLAYSSVEHMGILALGVGVGGIAGFGSMFHAVNHSVAKAMLFLAAGNTLAYFRTKSTLEARGSLKTIPITGVLWIVGLLAITGSPPFGAFISEFSILKGMIDAGRFVTAAFYLAALSIVFVGMSAVILPIVFGSPVMFFAKADAQYLPEMCSDKSLPVKPAVEPLWSIIPPLVLAMVAIILGMYLPEWLSNLLHQAAITVGAE
jgi:hydrogenase-4 component F